MTDVELREHWTTLVEKNVPNIKSEQVYPIVNMLVQEADFWHAVSYVQNRMDECPCELCVGRRHRPQYVAPK